MGGGVGVELAIHLAASELPDAVAALVRPLAPDGWLVLTLHAGAEVRHLGDWFGHEVDLDVVLHEPAFVVRLVEAAGLVDVEWYLRGPVSARGGTTHASTSWDASRPEPPPPAGRRCPAKMSLVVPSVTFASSLTQGCAQGRRRRR